MMATSNNAILPCPALISKLLFNTGLKVEQNEDVIILKTKIDHFTLEKSKSHLHVIDLDDEDNEEEKGEPSGAGPSRFAPSGADHDIGGEFATLNERLGRLEVSVNDGFSKIRQSFSDLMDLVHRSG